MFSVILVDDEPRISKLIAKYISTYFSDKFTVAASFVTAADALEYMNTHLIHLVITDIKMPGMDGLEFLRLIKQEFPLCTVVILSGYGQFEYAKKAIKYSAFNYILKPIDFSELNECLTSAWKHIESVIKPSDDYAAEKIEIFFLDLFWGSISTESEYNSRIQELDFSFPINDCSGIVLKVSVTPESVAAWTYSKELLENLVKNLFKTIMPELKTYLITKQSLSFYLVSFYTGDSSALQFSKIERQIKEIMDIDLRIEKTTSFSSLKDCINAENQLSGTMPLLDYSDDDSINRALEYINNNFQHDISRDDIAAAVYMSPGYFSYYFKQKTGMSPSVYITKLRIEKAIALLTTTNTPINELAHLVGYKNKNSFLLNFKNSTGCTPTEYRRKKLRNEI